MTQECPHVIAERAIQAKFKSPEWLGSPLRDFSNALDRFRINTKVIGEDGCGQHVRSVVTAEDIRDMIYARRAKAAVDPFAAWDYVTASLSESEMMRVADFLAKNPFSTWDGR